MKKSLFVLLSISLLFSCSSKLDKKFDTDRENFKLQSTFNDDISEYFTGELTCLLKDNIYLVSYSIYSPKKEFKKVNLLISPDKEYFYHFGYDSVYTFTENKESNIEKGIVPGIEIYFKSTVEIKNLYCYFNSEDISLYYKA